MPFAGFTRPFPALGGEPRGSSLSKRDVRSQGAIPNLAIFGPSADCSGPPSPEIAPAIFFPRYLQGGETGSAGALVLAGFTGCGCGGAKLAGRGGDAAPSGPTQCPAWGSALRAGGRCRAGGLRAVPSSPPTAGCREQRGCRAPPPGPMDASSPQPRAGLRKGMSSELAPLRRHASSRNFRKRLGSVD